MTVWFIDFETRSRAKIQETGLYRYAEDPSTEVLCMAYARGDDEPKLWLPGMDCPFSVIDPEDEFHAWNAGFEREIWGEILCDQFGWSLPDITQWRCTAIKSAHANTMRSLAGCSRAFDLKDDGKSAEGHKVMLKLCQPDRKGNWVEDPGLHRQLHEYCLQDVRAERALYKLLPDWPQSEVDNYHVDCAFCDRGVPIDVGLCEGAVKILDVVGKRAAKTAVALTEGEINTGGQVAKILKFVNERGVNIDNLQKETIDAVLAEGGIPDDAKAMLELRQSVAGAASKKYRAAINRVSADGRIRGAYMFYGAHTGRRSSPGLQLQNFKNCSGVTDSLIETIRTGDVSLVEALADKAPAVALGDAVRAMVCAPPGKTFVFCDYSQIEVRLAHWLAGNQRMLDLFLDGTDPYIDYAQSFFGVQEVSKAQRQFAKAPILGGQFGMGAGRLKEYAMAFGVDMTEGEAVKAIKAFRSQNPEIVKLWRDIDDALLICVQQKRPVDLRHIRFEMEGEWLTMRLPSGRKLFYRSPALSPGQYGPVFSYEKPHGHRERMWGGVFLENFTQATVRDLLANTFFVCYNLGLPAVIDQHDELGLEIEQERAEEVKIELVRIMRDAPDWAKGLPVDAEAKIQRRFLK